MFSSWFIWALGASVTWGVGQVIAKKGFSNFSPLALNLLILPFYFLLYLPYGVRLGVDFKNITLGNFVITLVVACIYLLYLYMISVGEISLTGTVLAAYPLITVALSLLFLGEHVSLAQAGFGVLVIFGIVLIGAPEKVRGIKIEKWFLIALAYAFVVGFADFMAKVGVNRMGLATYMFLYPFSILPGLVLLSILDRKNLKFPRISPRIWMISILGAVMTMTLGDLLFFTAFSKGPASLVSPVAASYQAITVVLALIFLKEKFRKIQAFGVALAILGIILIGR